MIKMDDVDCVGVLEENYSLTHLWTLSASLLTLLVRFAHWGHSGKSVIKLIKTLYD